jgi:homopolymeric O-antigen transport system permease protein
MAVAEPVAEHVVEIPTVTIAPPRGAIGFDVGPLWEYRQLLFFFTWRDLKVRYKQTVLGASWAILQPLLATIVFTIFFGRVAGLKSGGVPYLVFSFSGTLPWTYFSNAMTNGANSLVSAQTMIAKVYFPRIALPISAVLGSAFDLLCAAVILVPIMAWYGVSPSLRLLTLPLFFLLASTAVFGMSFFLSALNVRYRDVKYVLPFLTQLWMFATPVVYLAKLHHPWVTLYGLNPMVGVVEGFRWAIVGAGPQGAFPAPGLTTLVSVGSALAMLVAGAAYFRKVDQSMADVI